MSFVFISYSRQDKDYVSGLIESFEQRDVPVWIDDRIDYGTAWPRVIQSHLEQCQVFCLLMSERSFESHWVQCELALALEMKKPIFPLLLYGGRWLPTAAIQTVDVSDRAMPPASFFVAINACFERNDQFVVVPSADAESGDRLANLEQVLRDGLWKKADVETYKLLMASLEKEEESDLIELEDVRKLPCDLLCEIDALWTKYSNGKFGFSVQKSLYVDCGGVLDGTYQKQITKDFCYLIGWMKKGSYARTEFSIRAPKGHLPSKRRWALQTLALLLSRLRDCQLDLTCADLEHCLAASDWEGANQETYRLMIEAVGKQVGDMFDRPDLMGFSCELLNVIDLLWVRYSNGHFGFSVQELLFRSCGGDLDAGYEEAAWKRFCLRVGWQKKTKWAKQLTFDVSAPRGHLPFGSGTGRWCDLIKSTHSPSGLSFLYFSSIGLRLKACDK